MGLLERDESRTGDGVDAQTQAGGKDPKTMSAIELVIRTKHRVRLNRWQKDLAAAMGWKLRGRGRPKKKA